MASRKIVFWEVDVQADFMLPGGALYVPGAEKIIPNIKRLVDAARQGRVLLISHGCRHTPNDPEFKTFPPHCIRGTPGARIIPEGLAQKFYTIPNDAQFELPKDLLHNQQIILEKQTLDVFDNPHAASIVDRLGKEVEFVVFGVVTEFCVRLAAKGLLERGRRVSLVKDAIETLKPDEGRRTIQELKALGAKLITTDAALAMLPTAAAQPTAR
jgi:nicotinamidase/pyrazinamidase